MRLGHSQPVPFHQAQVLTLCKRQVSHSNTCREWHPEGKRTILEIAELAQRWSFSASTADKQPRSVQISNKKAIRSLACARWKSGDVNAVSLPRPPQSPEIMYSKRMDSDCGIQPVHRQGGHHLLAMMP